MTAHSVPSQLLVLLEFLLFLDDQEEFRVRCAFPFFHIPLVFILFLMGLYELLYEFPFVFSHKQVLSSDVSMIMCYSHVVCCLIIVSRPFIVLCSPCEQAQLSSGSPATMGRWSGDVPTDLAA